MEQVLYAIQVASVASSGLQIMHVKIGKTMNVDATLSAYRRSNPDGKLLNIWQANPNLSPSSCENGVHKLASKYAFERKSEKFIFLQDNYKNFEENVNLLLKQTTIGSMKHKEPENEKQDDVVEQKMPVTGYKNVEFDTLIVPAHEDGFNEVFLGENAWYAIRLSAKKIDKIKYIAAYRAAPVSGITHWATVDSIKKYKNTGKYIVHFKGKAKKIKTIRLISSKKGVAPQAPRYTTFKKLRAAKNFTEVFNGETEVAGKTTGRDVVIDQILPVIGLMKQGNSFAAASKTIAKKLSISVPSVRVKFYGETYLHLSASEVMESINSGRIKKLLIEKYPDRKNLIIKALGN